MANQFTRTRQIDSRDRRNKFARPETSDLIQGVSDYCKAIIKRAIRRCIELITYILKGLVKAIKNLVFSVIIDYDVGHHVKYHDRTPAFSMLEKSLPGTYKLDELYEPRDKVFNVFKKIHEDIIKKFHSQDFQGCIDACNAYIREMNSPAYMNHVRATNCRREGDLLIKMMGDAIKYNSDAILLSTF